MSEITTSSTRRWCAAGGIDLLFKKRHERLRQNVERHLAEMLSVGQVPAAPLSLVADYVAGALLTALTWWLDNDLPYTPEQMDAMFGQLVGPGVHAILGIPAAPAHGSIRECR